MNKPKRKFWLYFIQIHQVQNCCRLYTPWQNNTYYDESGFLDILKCFCFFLKFGIIHYCQQSIKTFIPFIEFTYMYENVYMCRHMCDLTYKWVY